MQKPKRRVPLMKHSVAAIDALLPQTQCGSCGYNGCLPYAEAIAKGLAPIDRCPPGGEETVAALAEILCLDPNPYLENARTALRPPATAHIREAECIGCTKCIQACPVDAILGSAKKMHSIIAVDCTGCGLCVAPCPVDCIEMLPIPAPVYNKDAAKTAFEARTKRLQKEADKKLQLFQEKRLLTKNVHTPSPEILAKQRYIQEAMARVQAKKQ